MPYGILKVDTITFTAGGVDTSVSISGLVQNPTFTGNITSTGTISGNIIQGGTTVSGATVTGTTANFVSGVFTTQISGTTIRTTTGVFASGTAAAPSITFNGDLDTGLFTSAANTVGIAANGSAVLTVSGTNVGIGTGSPGELLHVNGNALVKDRLLLQRLQASDNLSVLTFSDTLSGSKGNNLSLGNPGGFDLLFHTGGVEKARIDSSGRLGIGTNSPNAILDLTATAGAGGQTSVIRFGLGITAESWIGVANGVGNIIANSALGDTVIRNDGGKILLSTDSGTTAHAVIDSSGSVGIGTTSPGIISGLSKYLTLSATGSSEAPGIEIVGNRNSSNSTVGRISFINVATGNNEVARINCQTSASGPLTEGVLVFSTSGTSRLVINANGNVGIGTSSPDDPLHVVGRIKNVVNATYNITTSYGFAFRNATTTAKMLWGGYDNTADVGFIQATHEGVAHKNLLINPNGGNVGIGTTPTSIFHVKAATNRNFKIDSSGGSGGTDLRISALNDADSANVNLQIQGDQLFFAAGGAERARIDSSGRLGIGTTAPGNFVGNVNVVVGSAATSTTTAAVTCYSGTATYGGLYFADGTVGDQLYRGYVEYKHDVDALALGSGGSERARIDSSGRLLVGTSSSRTVGSSVSWYSQIEGTATGSVYPGLAITTNSNSTECAYLALGKTRGTSVGSNTIVQNGDALGQIVFAGADGTDLETRGAAIEAYVDGTPGANDMPGRLVFSTTADGASSPTERMRIGNTGVLTHTAGGTNSPGQLIASFTGGGIGTGVQFYEGGNTGTPNAANSTVKVGQTNVTGRSINAAGTVNVNGADYAEYMTKAGDFNIAKGDVCGIDIDGKLTITFTEAISFVVKSTDPSYVGNDSWGVGFEDDQEALEAERQKVDRVAFAGQVPVNVIGATPGQYIVPVEDAGGGIEGIAKNETDLTLAEYMRAVGKVIAIEDDGRARIIVKVA